MSQDSILKAIVHPAEEGGFWAEVPALPGCLTQGETLEELECNLHEAIEMWLSKDYATQEFNASPEQLDKFVEAANQELNADRKARRLKTFTGTLKLG